MYIILLCIFIFFIFSYFHNSHSAILSSGSSGTRSTTTTYKSAASRWFWSRMTVHLLRRLVMFRMFLFVRIINQITHLDIVVIIRIRPNFVDRCFFILSIGSVLRRFFRRVSLRIAIFILLRFGIGF